MLTRASPSIYVDHVRPIFGASRGSFVQSRSAVEAVMCPAGPSGSIHNTIASMELVGQALAQTDPPNVTAECTSSAQAEEEIPYHTRYYWKRGRPSMKEKAQSQQYLDPSEEKALVAFILRMSATKRPSEPPKKNWPQAFRRRHPKLKSRNNRPMPWERHDNSIHDKVVHWFDVIKEELCRPDVLPENTYKMDETGIMLSMLSWIPGHVTRRSNPGVTHQSALYTALQIQKVNNTAINSGFNLLGSVKVLVGTDDGRDYRGAGTKRTMLTAIECVSANGEYLDPMIIWPASTHRSNWSTYPTPGWFYARKGALRATFSIWRSQLLGTQDGLELRMVQEITDKVSRMYAFRFDQNIDTSSRPAVKTKELPLSPRLRATPQ